MRILVVEDSRVSRALLMRHLSHFGECTEAGDGVTGLESFKQALAENRAYDLVCLDLDLPGLDGLNVLSHIRRIESDLIANADALGTPRPSPSKVLIVTGSSDQKTVQKLQDLRVDGYLLKPIDPHRLAKIIEELPAATRPARSFTDDAAKALTALCEADLIPVPVLARLIHGMAISIERQSNGKERPVAATADV